MDTGQWVAQADSATCVGCRQCVRTCPSARSPSGAALVTDRFEPAPTHPALLLGDIGEIRSGFARLAEAQAEATAACHAPTRRASGDARRTTTSPASSPQSAPRPGGRARSCGNHRAPRHLLPGVQPGSPVRGSLQLVARRGIPVAIGRLERFVADALPAPPAAWLRYRRAVGRDHRFGTGRQAPPWSSSRQGRGQRLREGHRPGGLCNWGIPGFTFLTPSPPGHGASSSPPALTSTAARKFTPRTSKGSSTPTMRSSSPTERACRCVSRCPGPSSRASPTPRRS